jgi:hypothetical protein
MATAIANLGNRFKVSGISVQYDTDSFINVFKRRENFSYLPKFPTDNVGISYLSSLETLASRSVSIADRSSSLITNSVDWTGDYIVAENVSSYLVDTTKFLTTDEFTIETNSSTAKPLFLKHIISTTNVSRVSATDLTLVSGTILTEVKILDENFVEISREDSKVDFNKGIVYNNLEAEYDIDSNSYEAYWVQYTVRVGSDSFSYTEILYNQNVYTEATFDDLDEDLNIINDGRKVYFINEVDNQFDVIFAATNNYGFQIERNSKIEIKSFNNINLDKPWYPRITNGFFYALIGTDTYKYSIAQFSSQFWNPEKPYKKVTNESSRFLSSSLIKLNNEYIYENSSSSLYIDILINDQNDDGLAAFTTDSSLHGTEASNGATYSYWSFTNKTGIKGVNYRGGMIDIEGYVLKDTYKIYSSYYFEEKDFEFTSVDLNPINNRDILNQRLVIFIDPDTSISDKTTTLYYLIVNNKGKVIESDWGSFVNTTQVLTNDNPLYYSEVFDVTLEPTAEVFITNYSVEGSGIYLIVGECTIDSDLGIRDLSIVDSRIAGGGIVETKVDDAKELNPEIIWYWDEGRWDGFPYPGTASYLVEVPVEILSGAGGTFTQKQVRDVVEKHTALGVYPVVRAYGIDAFITDIEPRANSFYIKWNSYNPSTFYNIYYSANKDGPWTKSNTSLISDVSSGNSYEITGLKFGTIYYIMILGGELDNLGTWVAQCGQAIGPVSDGAKEAYNFNIAKAKTFGIDIVGTSSLGNRFEVT